MASSGELDEDNASSRDLGLQTTGGSCARETAAPRKAPHWTETYERWDGWEDPDDARKEREEEEKRLKDYREHNMSCAHDRSTERKVMEMSVEEKIEACQSFKHKGNLFHQEGQYRRAALQYRQALIYYDFCFPEEESKQQELDEMRQACLLNSAACFLACRDLDRTLDCCYQALREDPTNVKALYRRAVVYRMRDQFKEATRDLAKALEQRPNDVMLRKESAVLKSKIASYKERRKLMGKHIFGKEQGKTTDPEASPSHGGTGSPLDSASALDIIWDPSGDLGEAVGKPRADAHAFGKGDGRGLRHEEGRRRHDLSLPVHVDLSELEEMAGCAWPACS